MTCRRAFIQTVLQARSSSTTISKITFHHTKFRPSRSPFSSHQTVTPLASNDLLTSLPHDRSPKKNEEKAIIPSRKISPISTGKKSLKNEQNQSRKSTRVYPVRKQFIYESYLDLFTTNEVCLLYKHEGLSAREWNTIRGEIKNLSRPLPESSSLAFGEFKFTEEDEAARLKQQVPRVQVLRTKMILPVLKKLLKDSKIDKHVFRSLAYSPPSSLDQKNDASQFRPSHLTGPLFSITQPNFQPDQIKKIISILNAYSTPDPQKKQVNEKDKNNPKVQFLIGLIDQKTICKDQQELKKLSDLDSLDSLRSQIISLINLPANNLLFNLNFARASNLVFTLNSHIKTQQLGTSLASDNQSSDPQHPA